MFFSESDIQVMLSSLGELATLDDGREFRIIPDETSEVETKFSGEDIEKIVPFGLMSSEDVRAYKIVGGPEGTVVTFLGKRLRIILISHKNDGLAEVYFGDE